MPSLTFPLLTERLLLRPFMDGDFDALHAMQSREDVTRYLPWGPRSPEQTAEILSRITRMTGIDDDSDALRLATVLAATGAVVGDLSLWRISREHRQGEIGFVIHPDHQGRGYAVEGCAALLRISFEVYGFHRIVGRADALNAASARTMERLGMRREAHFHENELLKGEWSDEVVYAMLATEWAARPQVGR